MEPTASMVRTGRKSGKKYAAGTITDAPYVEVRIGSKYIISGNIR
jgi:hypothetical protein